MWFQTVVVVGTGVASAEEIEAGFNLMGIEFEVLVTVDDDSPLSKQARRYCYNNKWHDRVKKITSDPVEEVVNTGGVLVHFGNDLLVEVDHALFSGVPVILFPENFVAALQERWNKGGQ